MLKTASWLAVHSFKGGTGKSTIAANLAVSLAETGKNVAVVDMDLAGPGIHVIFGISESDVVFTLNDVFLEEANITQAVIPLTEKLGLRRGRVHFVPASYKLEDILRVLRTGLELTIFKSALESLSEKLHLDYVLVDTHPGIENDTLLAMGTCDGVLLVSRLDQQDLIGTAITAKLASELEKTAFLVFNMVPPHMDGKSLERLSQKLSSNFRITVLASLPFYYDVLQSLSKELFVLSKPQHEYSNRMRKMAQVLARTRFRDERPSPQGLKTHPSPLRL